MGEGNKWAIERAKELGASHLIVEHDSWVTNYGFGAHWRKTVMMRERTEGWAFFRWASLRWPDVSCEPTYQEQCQMRFMWLGRGK